MGRVFQEESIEGEEAFLIVLSFEANNLTKSDFTSDSSFTVSNFVCVRVHTFAC